LGKPIVLDASAVLAVLFNEPGAGKVIDLLPGSLVSTVSLAETHSRLLMDGRPAALAWDRVLSMGFEAVFFSNEHARLAGELIGKTGSGLSLGERACLALAIERNGTVYTTSRAWKNLPGMAANLDVVVIA
jgi:PIN domain nuclease of toxin-antitoxin system